MAIPPLRPAQPFTTISRRPAYPARPAALISSSSKGAQRPPFFRFGQFGKDAKSSNAVVSPVITETGWSGTYSLASPGYVEGDADAFFREQRSRSFAPTAHFSADYNAIGSKAGGR